MRRIYQISCSMDMMCPASWVAKPAFVSKCSGDSLRPIFRVTRPACNPSNLILTTKRRFSREKNHWEASSGSSCCNSKCTTWSTRSDAHWCLGDMKYHAFQLELISFRLKNAATFLSRMDLMYWFYDQGRDGQFEKTFPSASVTTNEGMGIRNHKNTSKAAEKGSPELIRHSWCKHSEAFHQLYPSIIQYMLHPRRLRPSCDPNELQQHLSSCIHTWESWKSIKISCFMLFRPLDMGPLCCILILSSDLASDIM